MIKDTLYGKYLAQRQKGEIIEDEHGFITYKIANEECFLIDMFVDQSYRGSCKFKKMLESLVEIANANQCKVISANIFVADAGAAHSLRSALHFGFKLFRAQNDVLLITFNLEGV